jgi:dTDP-4-amino-4,6-dideoxygalactose transaminase
VTLPEEADPGHVYHLFVVRSSRAAGRDRRGDLQRHLVARGIETLVHYPVSLPRQPALAGTHPADCPRAAAACDEVLSLPLHPRLGDHELARIAAAISEFSGKDRNE